MHVLRVRIDSACVCVHMCVCVCVCEVVLQCISLGPRPSTQLRIKFLRGIGRGSGCMTPHPKLDTRQVWRLAKGKAVKAKDVLSAPEIK